jgi:hypothetical protein
MNQSMKAQSVHILADAKELANYAGNYVEGRFYKVALEPEKIWYATSTKDLELIVNGTTFTAFVAKMDDFQQAMAQALGGKLGRTEQAADSAKFGGKSYAQVKTEWATDIAAREAVIMAALAQDVKGIFAINFQDGDAIDAAKLDVAAGKSYANLPDGKYMFVMNGPAKAAANVANYAGTDAPAAHQVSNNDYYLVTLAANKVTSIVRRNDTTNELMAAYQAALQELAERIGAVEGFTGANGVTRNGVAFELGGELTQHTIIEPGEKGYEFMFAGRAVFNDFAIPNRDKTKYFQLVFDENDDLVWEVVKPQVVAIHDAAHNGAHV